MVAKWHLFGLLGLTWDPSVADLGQPRTQLFDFLVPWGRFGCHQDFVLSTLGSRRDELGPLEVLIFRLWGCLGTDLWARVRWK